MFKKVEGEIQKHMMKAEGELQKHMNTIKPEEIRIGNYLLLMKNRLAEGGFGFIDLVTDASTKTDYCLKRCNVNHTSTLEIVKKEIHLLQLFTSPYIVQVLGTDFIQTKNGREALILLEYCPGGHLLERLLQRQGKYIHEHTIFKFFSQLLQAVSILHNNDPHVVHRDLKLENVLFASDGNLKLCDFGSCVIGTVSIKTSTERTEAESQINKETTPIYRSPEMVNLYMREELTEKTDIWALGCIFYAMCYLKLPFQEGLN
jgi:serine/threonine protein kinase